jgi:hypothetical protein
VVVVVVVVVVVGGAVTVVGFRVRLRMTALWKEPAKGFSVVLVLVLVLGSRRSFVYRMDPTGETVVVVVEIRNRREPEDR